MVACTSLYGQIIDIPKEQISFRPGAYGLVFWGRKLLLARMRNTGHFALPGGGVELGERLEEALVREVREETGIPIQVERYAGFKEHFFYYDPTGEAFHGFLFYFFARPLDHTLATEEQVDDGEVHQPQWVDVDELSSHSFSHHGEMTMELVREFFAGKIQ